MSVSMNPPVTAREPKAVCCLMTVNAEVNVQRNFLVLYQRGEEIKENDWDKRKRYQPAKLTLPFLCNSEHVVILCD